MIIYKNINIKKKHQNAVIAIGNFDGIHLGHQKVLNQARLKANKENLKFGVITFEPIPTMFFNKNINQHRINLINQKIYYLKKLKLDFLVIVRFNNQFSDISADNFIRKILVNRIKGSSALNLIMSFDYIKNVTLYDFLFGFGYFGYEQDVLYLFENSIFYDYYIRRNALNEVSLVGVLNFLMNFGSIATAIILMLFYNAKNKSLDKKIYILSLVIVFASMLKNSHTVDYFVHLFFIFGLAWSCRNETTLAKKY